MVVQTLQDSIKIAIDLSKACTDVKVAEQTFIDNLAIAIDAYIRTGIVTTVGSSTTQTGNIT